jgi:hypothetical protein
MKHASQHRNPSENAAAWLRNIHLHGSSL